MSCKSKELMEMAAITFGNVYNLIALLNENLFFSFALKQKKKKDSPNLNLPHLVMMVKERCSVLKCTAVYWTSMGCNWTGDDGT